MKYIYRENGVLVWRDVLESESGENIFSIEFLDTRYCRVYFVDGFGKTYLSLSSISGQDYSFAMIDE